MQRQTSEAASNRMNTTMCSNRSSLLLLALLLSILLPNSVSFDAHLTRPWKFKRGHLRIRMHKNKLAAALSSAGGTITNKSTSAMCTGAAAAPRRLRTAISDSSLASLGSSSTGDIEQRQPRENNDDNNDDRREVTRITPPLLETNSSLSKDPITKLSTPPTTERSMEKLQTIWIQLGPLTRLTRPQNFPGIFLFHLIGIYISLKSVNRMDMFVNILLGQPAIWLVLSSIVLVSCTSMVVNDYYDAKLGRDQNMDRPLVTGDLSFKLVRRYLSLLYAIALVCCAVLPGAPARLSVILSLMLTYWYTNHLKPMTWVKNAVCAFLIAFAPMTSGSAALHLVSGGLFHGLHVLRVGQIWRVVAMLFFGILGREMTMDCNDVENDRAVGVQTIPVVHGQAFTSRMAFLCAGVASLLAVGGPLWEMGHVPTATWARRLGLATLASAIQLTGAFRVCQTEGRDRAVVASAVDNGVKTVLLFLASFL